MKGAIEMPDETTFYRRADEWLDEILARNPVTATQLGNHPVSYTHLRAHET